MQIPKYIPKENRRHRIRVCDVEVKLIFAFSLSRLKALDRLISEYEACKEEYEKHVDYIVRYPEPRGLIHKSHDKTVERMAELRPQIEPQKIRFVLRLFDKMNSILGSPKLNEKYVLVYGDVKEWCHFPGFVELS